MKSIQIIPTITAETPEDFAREMDKLAFAPRIHIDISDGIFAPSRTINLDQIYFNREIFAKNHEKETREIDLHLMIELPQKWLHEIVSLRPDRVILHAENFRESALDFVKIREHLAKFHIETCVALLPESSPETFREILENADGMLIFGGKLGFQGGKADLSQLEKIKKIREINPEISIAWDGGANAENIRAIIDAGVREINVGAAISRSINPEKTWMELNKISHKISR